MSMCSCCAIPCVNIARFKMSGPYQLDEVGINIYISADSPGVYILARELDSIEYIGSTDNLKNRLIWWSKLKKEYKFFRFEITDSYQSAFTLECHLFHSYNNLDNHEHPIRPDDTLWQCPECDIYKVSV